MLCAGYPPPPPPLHACTSSGKRKDARICWHCREHRVADLWGVIYSWAIVVRTSVRTPPVSEPMRSPRVRSCVRRFWPEVVGANIQNMAPAHCILWRANVPLARQLPHPTSRPQRQRLWDCPKRTRPSASRWGRPSYWPHTHLPTTGDKGKKGSGPES